MKKRKRIQSTEDRTDGRGVTKVFNWVGEHQRVHLENRNHTPPHRAQPKPKTPNPNSSEAETAIRVVRQHDHRTIASGWGVAPKPGRLQTKHHV